MTIASHRSGTGSKTCLLDVAEDVRRRLMRTGIIIIVLSGGLFPLSEEMLRWFQVQTAAPLSAFGIADAFLALVTIALGAGAVAAVPYGAWEVLCAAAKVFPELTRRTRWLFWSASVLLAVPLYFLFELGILGMRLCERRRQNASVMDSISV